MPKASNLFHSALSKMGIVTVKVIHEKKKSKYPGKPDYVHLEIDGANYYYSAENQACADWFDGQRGKVLSLRAEGREDTATINYVGQPASTMAPPQQQTPPPMNLPPAAAPQATPPGAQHAPPAQEQTHQAPPAIKPPQRDPVKDAEHFVAKNANLCGIALRAATMVKNEYETWQRAATKDGGFVMHYTTFNAVYTSCLFGASNAGIPDDMPVKWIGFPVVAPPVPQQTGGQQ